MEDVTVDVQEQVPRLLLSLEEYLPTVPDELTQHYLRRAGHNCEDVRLGRPATCTLLSAETRIRLLSVTAQRFAATVVNDALQMAKRRRKLGEKKKRELGYAARDRRLLLNSEDLAEALKEFGVNLAQPLFYTGSRQEEAPTARGGAANG